MDAKYWYEQNPNRVTENEYVTIVWYLQIIIDRHIHHNKLGIVITEKETDMCLIIDVAIPSDYNIQKRATAGRYAWMKFGLFIQCIWGCKSTIVCAVLGIDNFTYCSEGKGLTVQHIYKTAQSSFCSWTMHVNLNKVQPPYINSLATRWHITGNPTASYSMKPFGKTLRRGCWAVRPCSLE